MLAVQENGLPTLYSWHGPLHAALQSELGHRIAIWNGQVEEVHAVGEHHSDVVCRPVSGIQHVPNTRLSQPGHAAHRKSPTDRQFLVHPTQVQTVELPHQISFLCPRP